MAELGPRGKALYDALKPQIAKHEAATEAMLVEAARLADRLEVLDDIIDGKDVLGLLRFRLCDQEGNVAEVKFDAVMSEARQQQAAFASVMKVILPNLDAHAAKQEEVSGADEIAARRAARGTGAARPSRAARSR